MLQAESYGPVKALHMGRNLLGVLPPFMTVRCYAIDGLLVDTGLISFWKGVKQFAREQKTEQVVLTHHHEDHSGNAANLQNTGYTVWASEQTALYMQRGFAIHFYERMIWGKAPTMQAQILGDTLETENHRFEVIHAPGHANDQVVLYEPSEGWLFAGDAFIADRIKIFRADEDFDQTVSTVKNLLDLDFDALYCAHRPVPEGGKEAMKRKLDYLLSLEEKVKYWAGKGLTPDEITQKTLGAEDKKMDWFTAGDVSKRNVVNSILNGPTHRKENHPSLIA